MAEFDYDRDGPDIETIRSVAAEMANAGKPPAMTDAEREEWRVFREQQEWLAEHQRRESERRRAEAKAAQEAEANRQQAIARSERNAKLREEMARYADRQMQSRQLSDLHQASIRNEQFRSAAIRSQAFANQQQQLIEALDAMYAAKYPTPPPEPTVVIVSEDDGSADLGNPNFDIRAWSNKRRSWF
jgi:hypothetical protein